MTFKNKGTEDIFNGKNSKAARKTCPEPLWKIAARKLDQLDSIALLDELRIPPGNWLEVLGGDRGGQHSIRINNHSIVSASSGLSPVPSKWRLWIITKH